MYIQIQESPSRRRLLFDFVKVYPLHKSGSFLIFYFGKYKQHFCFQFRFHTYRVVLAEHDMDKEEGPEQSIMVAKMFIHPKWNDNCVSCGYVQQYKVWRNDYFLRTLENYQESIMCFSVVHRELIVIRISGWV